MHRWGTDIRVLAVSFAREPVYKLPVPHCLIAALRLERFLWILLVCCAGQTHAQSLPQRGGLPPQTGLVPPLQVPLVLAGNFGELRANHFHTGLDFKTQGKEGLPIIAATDGVISRIRTGPYGYGNALYLNSPEGLTTVYAHLQRFAEPLNTWLCEEQYRSQQNEWDAAPRRAFSFSQGDTLGWSGNSGSSGGPHLHFEVRETATQRPINPLLWDFDVADSRAPQLSAVWVIPEQGSSVDGRAVPVRLDADVERIEVAGRVRVAVEAFDRLSAAHNVCGVYRIAVELDSLPWFEATLDTLDFSVARDMNAHAYYPAWQRNKDQIHRLHRLPGNRLPIYDRTSRSGLIDVLPAQSRELHITVVDVHGNQADRTLILAGILRPSASPEERPTLGKALRYDAPFAYADSTGLRVNIPADAFYEDAWFACGPAIGKGWHIGSSDLPSRKDFTVELPEHAGCGFRGHVAVRWEDDDIEAVIPGRPLVGGGLKFTTRNPGVYFAACDTVPPHIAVRSLRPSGLPEQPRAFALQFEVADDLSGVEEVSAWADGCWLRLQWDPKKDRAHYLLEDGRHLPGEIQTVVFEARDAAGNVAEWSGQVRWP